MILQLILLAAVIFRNSDGFRSDLGDVTCYIGAHHVGDGSAPLTGYMPGEKAELECRPGYYFDRFLEATDYSNYDVDGGYRADDDQSRYHYVYDTKPRVIECQNDGRWNKPVPSCHVFSCPSPPAPRRGIVQTNGQSIFNANDTVTYHCNQGTVLVGMASKTCEMSWNGWSYGSKPPMCLLVRCPDVAPPINGWIDHKVNEVGSTVRFFCQRSGYELYGSANLTCQPNGKWSGDIPICLRPEQEPGCDNPLIPVGGRIVGDKERTLGAEVTYDCFDRFYLDGPAKRTCGPLGWSPTSEPECEVLHVYDNQDDLAQTFASIVDRFSSDANPSSSGFPSRRYDLYFLFDSSHSVPRKHFDFAKKFVELLIDELAITGSDGTAVGLLSFSSDAKSDFSRGGGIHTQPGRPKTELRKKLIDLQYIDGDTDITGALKFVKDDMIPVSARDVPKVIFLLSDGDVTHGGNPLRPAKALKDLGVEIFTIQTGTVRDEKTRAIMEGVSSADRFPKHYPHFLKIRQDSEVLKYIAENFKSHTPAPGVFFPEYPVCGLSGDVEFTESYKNQEGGDVSKSTSWPWMMTINKIVNNKAEFLCTGTLISDQWVLTSAQCVTEAGVALLVKSATSPDTFDGELVSEKFPRKKPSDIALLKLVRPIKIGPYVRPICLPNDIANLADRFDDYAVTTGWNGTDTQRPTLVHAAVPILRDNSCRDSNPVVGYCAGLEIPVNGTSCPQDVGSPLMIRSRLDKATRTRHWLQIGVAWQNDGCTATGGNSGRFVRLDQRRLTWIRRTMSDSLTNSNLIGLTDN